jgi:ammonium transporter, Amt family
MIFGRYLSPLVAKPLPRTATASALLASAVGLTPQLAAAAPAATAPGLNTGNTAWLLMCTVLVLVMTLPGLILFYSGMLRGKNALSVAAHTVAAAAVITLLWCVLGYSLAFTPGNGWLGGTDRLLVQGLFEGAATAHPLAPTVPEAAFLMFQLAFAIVTFSIILGATAERMRMGVTVVFAAAWCLLVYAPVAHWVWQPTGWLAELGHMDFAGGTVVHVSAGASALVAAWMLGPRIGFGREAMVPHNLMLTVLGAGLLWVGWFGFNAGSAFEASSRAANAMLVTQVAACAGAMLWGVCEYVHRGQWSALGSTTGAIAGLIAITPASGYVDVWGALVIGAAGGVTCFLGVVHFKARTGIDDALDVFALHGIGGLVGTALTPVFGNENIAKVTDTIWVNLLGACAVMAWSALATFLILKTISWVTPLRVNPAQERLGLDIAQHGEMLVPTPSASVAGSLGEH